MLLEDAARAWAEPFGVAVAAVLGALLVYAVGRRIVDRLTRHSRVL
jgi:membrane protein DedA with SNARE-associated domain